MSSGHTTSDGSSPTGVGRAFGAGLVASCLFGVSLGVASSGHHLAALVFLGASALAAVVGARLRRARVSAERDELSRLRERTRESDLQKKLFTDIAHGLRTPLSLVTGPTQALLASPGLSPSQRSHLEVIARNTRTLLRGIDDMLDVARLEAGKLALEYSDVDLSQLVRVIASHFASVATERRITFTIDAGHDHRAEFDAKKIERILLNLLSNAFKFTPVGGRIRVRARVDNGRARIEVADSGTGIPPDRREAVFERFGRTDDETPHELVGSGLGLAMSRELVALHGGTLSVGDTPLGGAAFRVELPVRAPEGARLREVGAPDVEGAARAAHELLKPVRTHVPADEPRRTEDSRPRVLVVEDNEELNAFMCEILASEYDVTAAFDGREGLDLALQAKPDLILTDLVMPAMSGEEMVQRMRTRHRELDVVPILIITASLEDDVRVRLLREGADDCLTKPFAIEELHARIGNLIARKRNAERTRALASQLEKLYEREGAERAWLQTVVEQMPEGVLLMDASGHVTMRNRALLSLSGPERAERDPFGNPLFLDMRTPEGEPLAVDDLPYVRAIRSDEPVAARELCLFTEDHRLVPAVASAVRVVERSGKTTGVILVVQDISSLKQLERLREEWTSIVAHDLRQPAGVIATAASLLAKRTAPHSATDDQLLVERIHSAARRLSRMIDDLLDASRIEAHRLDMKPRDIDLAHVVAEMVEQMPDVADRCILSVEPRGEIHAWADPDRIDQVLANLLSNAIKYGEHDADIHVDVRSRNDHAEVVVSNRGPGIPEDEIASLFQRFVRTETARAGPRGLGLGLYISKGLVEAHGGRMWVESSPGAETSFHFTLPRGPRGPVRVVPSLASPRPSAAG